jgi:hypothetical protein
MVTGPVLKYLLKDDESLESYLQGMMPSYKDIRRRLFLKLRSEDRNIPDHHYHLLKEMDLGGIDDLSVMLSKGIGNMASAYLELRGKRIYVKPPKQNEWQELITYLPPLLQQAALLLRLRPLSHTVSNIQLATYYAEYIYPNTRYTCLPYPYIPKLEAFIANSNGFHDLHMHLNGTTEVDRVWQDCLHAPASVYAELKTGWQNEMVKEQLEQESHLLSPFKFYNMLLVAQRLRKLFFSFVFIPEEKENRNNFNSLNSLLFSLLRKDEGPPRGNFEHPFRCLVSNETIADSSNLMSVECLMYVLVLSCIENTNNPALASLFHFYLLINGLSNRLLVQQTHQYGFDQFQKHTINELRTFSERFYRNRFFQLHGNDMRNIAVLEGRFSPKQTEADSIALLKAIEEGWVALERQLQLAHPPKTESCQIIKPPELILIAHFIKRKEKINESTLVRHQSLRSDVWKKGEVLALLKKNHPTYCRRIVGIDAASNEFDAPPEVFAPVFRKMRRSGFNHFTYHAGEDFFHVISGLRAIYEAVEFNELQIGDRIGHATATGLSAIQWISAVGNKLYIRQGEWLDNLIFVYYLITDSKQNSLHHLLPALVHQIQEIASFILGRSYPVYALAQAWLARRYCPLHVLATNKSIARRLTVFDDEEWCDIQQANITQECKEILFDYHCPTKRKFYLKPVLVDTSLLFNEDIIEMLQKEVLLWMHQKEIVIETLPTSNVRIGHHKNYKSYHLWNWLKWEEEGLPIPPVVLGTDDAGIFATNIYNEYANIYCCLTNSHNVSHVKAMQFIERLERNASVYKFRDLNT